MPPQPINLSDKLSLFSDHWHPRIVAELNGQQVKLAKLIGEFEWHAHEQEDELFLVIEGSLEIELENAPTAKLGPGEMLVVPRGVQHRPIAKEEVSVMLFEPSTTVNTGDNPSDRTRNELDWI